MRNRFADTFYELGKADPRLCVVVADISPAGSIAKFRNEFPRRFINTGVSEQIMIGMVAGMAQRGLRPFAYTIATFTLYRPFEMVRDDLCYQNLPVTIVGIGGGVTYSTLGATHHAQEDVAIACYDPEHVCDRALRSRRDRSGDALVRATSSAARSTCGWARPASRTSPASCQQPWEFGKVRQAARRQRCLHPVLRADHEAGDRRRRPLRGRRQASRGLFRAHAQAARSRRHLPSILRSYPQVVVIEECAPNGSLAMRVKELAWSRRRQVPARHVHAAGCVHPLLRLARRHPRRAWSGHQPRCCARLAIA